jgi:ubiquinone/menaquinone biosynthesis C-methylase UbiE
MSESRTSRSESAPMRIAEASDYDALYATGGYMTGATDVYEYSRLKTIHASLRKLASEFSPESILEVGCGQARWFEIIRQYFPHSRLLGVDFSTTAIAAARSRFPEATFYVGVAEDLGSIPNGSVDLVLNVEVLEHVANARKTVSEFARVLKPQGHVLITTPCANRFSLEWTVNFLRHRLQEMPDGFHRFGTDPPEHIRRLNSKELNEIMMEAGLTQDWVHFRARFFTWPSFVAARLGGHFAVVRQLLLRVFGEIAYLDWRLFRWFTNGASMIGQWSKPPKTN